MIEEQPSQTTQTTSLVNQQPSATNVPDPVPPAQEQPKPPEVPKPEAPLTAKDIKLPEGFEADVPVQESFLKIANEHKLSRSTVEALVNLQADVMRQASERGSELWSKTQENWRKEIQADPTYGGTRLETNLSAISRLIDLYAVGPQGRNEGAEIRQTMDLTGAGNNPAMIRWLTRIANALVREGEPVQGQPGAQPRTHADILFPNQGKT